VLGRLLLPVIDEKEPFELLVWVSLSPRNFRRRNELWTAPGREGEPPVGERACVELEPTSHPLALAQRDGLTRPKLQSLIRRLMHPQTEAH
jgi:hypothetical protein